MYTALPEAPPTESSDFDQRHAGREHRRQGAGPARDRRLADTLPKIGIFSNTGGSM